MPGTAVRLDAGCVETVKPHGLFVPARDSRGTDGRRHCHRPAFQTQRRPLVFTNVTVIDMAYAVPQRGVAVEVIAGRIADVGKAEDLTVPKSAQVAAAAASIH